MIVAIGFVPEALGNALASPIQTPGVSWSSPQGLATEVAGSRPIRQLPIWCAEKVDELARDDRQPVHRVDERLEVVATLPVRRPHPAADDLAGARRLVDAGSCSTASLRLRMSPSSAIG